MIFTLKYVTYLERNIGKEKYQFPKLEDTLKQTTFQRNQL